MMPTSFKSASERVRKTDRSTSCSSNTLKYFDRFKSLSNDAKSDGFDDVTVVESAAEGVVNTVDVFVSERGSAVFVGVDRSLVVCDDNALLLLCCDCCCCGCGGCF